MRVSHIAWIGAVLTFAVVLGIGLSRQRVETPRETAAVIAPTVESQSRSLAQARAVAEPASSANQNSAVPAPVEFSADPPEDGRAMMEAAAADPDPAVRDEAAALSRAVAGEAETPPE